MVGIFHAHFTQCCGYAAGKYRFFFPILFLLLCLQKDKKYTIFAECNVGNFALNTQYMSYFNIFLMVKMEHVSKITMLGLKRMVKSGLEICILKFIQAQKRLFLF